MQLRLAQPFSVGTKVFSFRQALSVALTTITTGGAFAVVAFGTSNFKDSIIKSLDPAKKALLDTTLLNGINKLGTVFHSWGTTVVAAKDDFKEWVDKYLNPSGLKSGVVELYNKLYAWAEIVYDWFKNKFLIFISRIPDMVKNWKQLRLSLFKWGTFLGGGGAGALWSMFGSFDDIGKLADLMRNEDFMAAAEQFAELVGDNPDAFKDMGEENMKEILERIAEEPKDALEIIKELKEKQKELEKEKLQEQEGQEQKEPKDEKPQLKKEQVMDAFKEAKGSPRSKDQVFGNLAGNMLQKLSNLKNSFFGNDASSEFTASQAMKEYMQKVEAESVKDTKSGKPTKIS